MTINDTNGHTNSVNNATNGSSKSYSVPNETQHKSQNARRKVQFKGTSKPSIPINWRFAESISALKGLEAAMINVLLKRKYGLEPQEAIIDTDHAQLFFMSILLNVVDPEGEKIEFLTKPFAKGSSAYNKYFKNCDKHDGSRSTYRVAATNIYRCKDGRYFHLHGSMNPDPTQESVGLPYDKELSEKEEPWTPYVEKLAQIGFSGEMQKLALDVYKQAGTICWTTEEFKKSEHGKANAHVGLYEVHDIKNKKQPACWWSDSPETSAKRPFAGLKVVHDLTRVIAAPALTRGLAELGASVMRVTAEHITDMSMLHEEDREKLRALVRDADVVVQGYRPGVLDKYGFSPEGLLDLTKDRERGLIVVRENCYGWYGPWSYRSGWQQISDACCGVSMEFGRAMGRDEPVTPVFPNSDFCTGTSGVIGVLNALLRRGAEGGSYKVDVALNYYSQWLVNSVGTYPKDVWEEVWTRNGHQVFRHYHNMQYTLPHYMKMLAENSGSVLFKPDFFEVRHAGAIGKDVKAVKPIIQYPQGNVKLGYNVGTRGNGVDQPVWPKDLMTEVVS
ncbi:unnamed protein product [Alternaria alternata]